LEPLRALVGYFSKRLLTQKHRWLEQVLREAQLKLTGILDQGSLFQSILVTVEQLQPRALCCLRSRWHKYRRVRAVGHEPPVEPGALPPLREMLANHGLLQHCERLQKKGELPVFTGSND